MGNLTGANFRDWVKNQINVRQTKLALQNRDNETLVWSNSKTSWLRMISSVSVTPEKSKELIGDENYSGRKLAQNYVLFGGVVNSEGDQPVLKQGIATSVSPDSSPLTNSVYGFNETRGLSPMPGLTNASIKSMNRGALKQAEIQFVAQNKEQFKILDALYMRPGFTILLEWGHTLYFDNDSILQRASYNTKPFEIFKTGEYKENKPDQSAQQVILEEIDKHRESTDGNYDGFYGKITNFDWTLNTDGTYNIKIRAISIGDIIESLNISRPLPSKDEDSDNEEVNSVIARRDKSKLDRWLYFRYNSVVTRNKVRRPTSSSTNEIKAQISFVGDSGINRETLAYYPNQGKKKVYMKLGVLLKYINDNLLIVNSQNQNYISIDSDFDSNLCTTHPFQFSADPNICVIPFYSPKLNGGTFDFNTKNTSYFNQITLNNFRQTDSDYVGKLMHIHVNINYITSVIESSTDEETQSLYLQSFLQNLMNGIQGALGGINKFTVSYNNEENLIKIYDDVPLDPKVTKTNEGEVATFRAFGIEPGIQGSFVTNVSLNATISPDFATMISIGAQANGTNDIINATALTKFNKGLTDSITPVKQSTDTTEKETPESRLSKNYSKFTSNGGLIFEFYFRADPATNIIPSSKYLNAQFNKYLTSYLSVNKKVPSTQGFIPFDLGLEMEGIAGPRIYEKFSISGDILPSSYPQNLAFLIKGLNHTIDAKGWSTTIDSLSYEAPNEQAIPVVDKVPESPAPKTPPEEDFDGEGGVSLERTIKSSNRMAIVNKYGWPIKLTRRVNGIPYGEVYTTDSAGRVVYKRDYDYLKKYSKIFTYKDNNGNVIISKKLHEGLHEPLRKSLQQVENSELIGGVYNIDASVYARDTTNAPGLLSGHSFGVAMDFNSKIYGYGKTAYNKYLKDVVNPQSKNYNYAKAIELISNNGLFYWGGDYRGDKDTHHFTFLPFIT